MRVRISVLMLALSCLPWSSLAQPGSALELDGNDDYIDRGPADELLHVEDITVGISSLSG